MGEEYLYAGCVSIIEPYQPNYVTVGSDNFGMRPDSLRAVLEKFKRIQANFPGDGAETPKVLYLNPTGANPTGTMMPRERREEIYAICSEFDLLIVEDDPYYFVRYDNLDVPSFMSLDVDGRVLRVDSFSKLISAGMRIGFITGPKPLIRQLELHSQVIAK